MASQHLDCLHEEQIQGQSRKIAEIETEIKFKEKRIDDVYQKIDKMENKLDLMNENINTLILQSTKGDTELDNRLIAIETELAVQKQTSKDNLETYKVWLAIVTVALTLLTIYLNFFH